MISLHDAGIMDFHHGSMKNHTQGMTSHIMGESWAKSMISYPVQICDVKMTTISSLNFAVNWAQPQPSGAVVHFDT